MLKFAEKVHNMQSRIDKFEYLPNATERSKSAVIYLKCKRKLRPLGRG
jgi:hypothetical protein